MLTGFRHGIELTSRCTDVRDDIGIVPEADTENVAYGDDAGSGDEGSYDDDCSESY